LFSNGKESITVYFFVAIFKKNFTLSHTPLRNEKDCLNCGTTVQGRYCHVCGQENAVPKETFWHMVTHFFNDITHFDGSFFVTVKDLLFKPGFLSKEYMMGRRASYLHPVRMYVFTSAIFFLLFFSFFISMAFKSTLDDPLTKEKRNALIKSREEKLIEEPGKTELLQQLELLKDTTKSVTIDDVERLSTDNIISFSGRNYMSIAEYDSLEKALPVSKRDGWFKRRVIKKVIGINNKYRGNSQEALDKLGESILHKLPYMLFLSLPLFALILRLVYIRRKWRKQFYIADHGVFTIHFYVFSFILLLLVFTLGALQDATQWKFISWLGFILIITLFFYLYKAMRNFYGQGWLKTFFKFILVTFSSIIMMVILFIFFTLFSAATL
jgi:Protein of unknown function (DUF3667)